MIDFNCELCMHDGYSYVCHRLLKKKGYVISLESKYGDQCEDCKQVGYVRKLKVENILKEIESDK